MDGTPLCAICNVIRGTSTIHTSIYNLLFQAHIFVTLSPPPPRMTYGRIGLYVCHDNVSGSSYQVMDSYFFPDCSCRNEDCQVYLSVYPVLENSLFSRQPESNNFPYRSTAPVWICNTWLWSITWSVSDTGQNQNEVVLPLSIHAHCELPEDI